MESEVESPAGLPRAKRRKAWMLPAGMVLVVTMLALMVWLRRMGEGEVVREHVPASGESSARELVEIGAFSPRLVIPPEPPHDPIADPFGAPPRRGGTGLRGHAAGDGKQARGPLATRPAPGSWMLEPGTIAGWIMGSEQRPLAHARVCAFVVDPRASVELRRRPRCTEADRRGRFVLRDLPPSAYDLSASAPGFVPQGLLARDGHPLVVQPGDGREGIVLALSPGGVEVRGTVKTSDGAPLRTDEPFELVLRRESVLVGRVVDAATGEPVEMARVRAGPRARGIDPLVHTNEHGEFEIAALPAGSYVPTARTDTAHGQAKRPVRLEEGTLSADVVIEVSPRQVATPASLVLDSGEVVDPRVRVTGNASKDPAVARCAQAIVRTMKLMPRREPTVFKTLVVEI